MNDYELKTYKQRAINALWALNQVVVQTYPYNAETAKHARGIAIKALQDDAKRLANPKSPKAPESTQAGLEPHHPLEG